MNIDEAIKNLLDNSDILYHDEIISKEKLVRAYASFISQTMGKRAHNLGLVLHPGSVCFDVLSITMAAIVNLISNETSSTEVVESLEVEDMVLYGKKKKERYVFKGIIDGECFDKQQKGIRYAVLQQKNDTQNVSEGLWRYIVPYNGKSTRTDGRGIKKKGSLRDDFFVEVLGYSEEDVPGVIDTSSVFVLSRDKADLLVNDIKIKFNGKTAGLLDLVTASYYTEDEEYIYKGNPGKNEPVLKLCSRVSVARDLILSKKGNYHIGLFVLGQEAINRGQFELPELMNRKSLKYVYVCTSIDSGYGLEVIEENEEAELFACTKGFLVENGEIAPREENTFTKELAGKVNNILYKSVIPETITGFPIDWKEYLEFKKLMLSIKRLDYESTEKDDFIVLAHSLMKLFKTAVFSMDRLEAAITNELIDIKSPSKRLEELSQLCSGLPNSIQEKGEKVIDVLNGIYISLKYETPKEKWLRNYILLHKEEKIAIVVPKAYFNRIICDTGMFSSVLLEKIKIMTAGRFEDEKTYDSIVVVGDFQGKKFDSFLCNASEEILNLLYEIEFKAFRTRQKNNAEGLKKFVQKSSVKISYKEPEENFDDLDESEEFVETVDNEIETYISNIDTLSYSYTGSGYKGNGRSNMTTEIIAIGILEDDRRVFFSRHYKAYVFDRSSGTTNEVGTTDLCDGDSVVFTKNNENTKDIVDSMLVQLISDNQLSKDMVSKYHMSKEWQNALWDYMETNEMTIVKVAEKLISFGVPVQIPTIIRWMDEDAHTVGPRNVDSIMAIGKMTGNEKMANNPEVYFEACREIRGLRRRLLSQIGEAIIGKLSGKKPVHGSLFSVIYDKIDDLSEILQIERIIQTEKTMPLGLANRPINLRGE